MAMLCNRPCWIPQLQAYRHDGNARACSRKLDAVSQSCMRVCTARTRAACTHVRQSEPACDTQILPTARQLVEVFNVEKSSVDVFVNRHRRRPVPVEEERRQLRTRLWRRRRNHAVEVVHPGRHRPSGLPGGAATVCQPRRQ